MEWIAQTEIDSHTVADALASLNKLHVLRGRAWPLTFRQEVRPPPFPASSLCFNEAPGRFWKALELNAVHPFQTAASSSGPSEPRAKPGSAPLPPGCSSPDRDYGFSRCRDAHATQAAPTGSAFGQWRARPSRRIPEPCRESDSSARRRTPLGPGAVRDIKTRKPTVGRHCEEPCLPPYGITLYPPIVQAMRHVHTERVAQAPHLIGRRCGIVLDQSRGRGRWGVGGGGNAWELHFHSVRGDGEQSRSRGGAADDPAECQKMQRSPDSYWARAAHE